MSSAENFAPPSAVPSIDKCPTGIRGLDDITSGGLPHGRPTLVCGNAGCGKTILAMEFLVNGARDGEPGVFMSFEEKSEELVQNFASLGFDLAQLQEDKKLAIDYIHIERSEIEETGEYDLDGLFIRLNHAIDSIGAKRVVLDTVEALFSGFTNTSILRAELRRLFRWLKDKGVTAIITGERGGSQLTRHGLEEYVADCVILLDMRVDQQVATRRLRVVKYRGTIHGGDEYPFLIGAGGISILPITSLGLDHPVSTERFSTGIERLDTMFSGQGLFRGSTVLISGNAGSGKSSIASRIVEAACQRGERCLYFAFEESPAQITRNMRSVGVDLGPPADAGLLTFCASRPSGQGLEMHLVKIHERVLETKPSIVVFDPVSNLTAVGNPYEAKIMLTRLIDFLKTQGISAVMTDLTHGANGVESSTEEISSLIDTWLCLRDLESNGERNRGLYILKSRGMSHSNQIREFVLSSDGIDLVDVYLDSDGILTGTARRAHEARQRIEAVSQRQDRERRQREIDAQQAGLDARMAALRVEQTRLTAELEAMQAEAQLRQSGETDLRATVAASRKADAGTGS
ncbi:KaiC family protein [bacterium]|nr:KaiC family protein [bacterium]